MSKANRRSLNIEGAYRHVLTDLYGFMGTVIAGILIVVSGFARADPIASLVVVALMLKAAAGLLRPALRILLEATPDDIDLEEVRRHLLEFRKCPPCTTCTCGRSLPPCPSLQPMSWSLTTASAAAKSGASSITCRAVWRGTSMWRIRPCNSRPLDTSIMRSAATRRQRPGVSRVARVRPPARHVRSWGRCRKPAGSHCPAGIEQRRAGPRLKEEGSHET